MPQHSNSDLQKHIESDSSLISKMAELTQQLQTQLFSDFQTDMGVPVPTALEASVRQVEYTMVYSTDPILSEYMSGAKTLLDGVFEQDWPKVADTALDVVQTLLNNVVGSSTIQTGANNQSLKIPANQQHTDIIAAAFTEVEECSAQDWATQTNFYLAYYAFVVWQPTEEHLAAIAKAKPALT